VNTAGCNSAELLISSLKNLRFSMMSKMGEKTFSPANRDPLPPPPQWIMPAMLVWYILSAQCMTSHRDNQAISIFSILLPAGKIRLSCGAILIKLFLTMLRKVQPTVFAYTLAIHSLMLLCRWIDLTVVYDPERDFWLVDKTGKGKMKDREQIKNNAPSRSLAKLKWWTAIFLNVR
jgi:hypothetical protein